MTEIASPEPTHANSAGAATNGNGDGGNAHAHALAHNNNEPQHQPFPQKDTSSLDIDIIDIDTISISSRKSDELSSLSEDVFSGDSFEPEAEAQARARAPEAAPPSDESLPPNVNGHARDPPRDLDLDPSAMDDEPPAKRRRVRDTTPASPARRPKPISPPWKKIEAEGPSSFTEGGRRKSGRINTLPLELQHGDKRITRRALHGQQASPPRNRYASTNGHSPASNSTPSTNAPSKRPASSTKPMPSKAPASASAPRVSARKAVAQDTKAGTRSRRRSASPPRRPTTPTRAPAGTRRSTRRVKDAVEDTTTTSPGTTRTTPRIVLKPRPPLTTIPLVHREQANIRPKLGPSFEEYFERGLYIPVSEGGLLLEQEDGPEITDEIARHDAQIILQVEKEVEEGGILAKDRCSLFQPEPEEEPPRQWAHLDHLTKAMSNFRKLLLMEQQRHRAAAKRLAIACEAEWRRRNPQPQTAEEIEFEEMEQAKARWRQVNKAIAGTWENVRVEINRRRLVEWEAEEQRRVKAALNQAVNLSEQKLQARQARLDTEELTDESDMDDMGSNLGDDEGSDDEDGDEGSSAVSADDESNMSSSDDDEDKNSVRSDEGLTQDQLRAKYADLPGLTNDKEDNAASNDKDTNDMVNGDDTSDESVDMDDDLGSTEDESAGDEEDGEEEDSDASESEEEPAGLLGLFFRKSELKQLKQEVASEKADPEEGEDMEMADADDPVESKPFLIGHAETNGTTESTSPPTGGEVWSQSSPGASANHAATTNGTSFLSGDSTPTNALGAQALSAKPVFIDDNVPLTTPVPQSVSAAVPISTSSMPAKVEQTRHDPVEPPDDISMADAPPLADSLRHDIPKVQITEASANPQHSPDTDAITTLPSPSRSQSPRTSDTKPSDVETPTSGSLLNVPKTDSRSTSPQPAVPKTEIPFLLRGTLREYQHHGLDWLATLYRNKTNGILADEMGLGKTIQTIALLAHLACQHEVWGPHLVIVPTSVMLNWEMEFKKWCPGFKILTYYGNQEERKRKRQGWTNDDVWNVCITSYQMVLQDQQVFRRRRWHYMILDEAHNIKNFKSQRWQTLLGFNTHSRLLLTGTPLQNNLTELWSLLYFLAPPENGEGGFVDLREFHNWFSRPESQILESGREQLDDEARAIISKLHKVLRPYLLRRLKADVEKQMPAKYEHVEFCRLSKRQRELYDGFLSRNDTRETLESGNYMSIINCLMQLRKVCNHPDLFVDRPIMTSFRMQRSVPADYDIKERVIRQRLLAEKPMSTVSLSFLNMLPVRYEGMSSTDADQVIKLSSHRILLDLREAQKVRANNAYTALDPSSVKSTLVYLESAARWGRYEELQHCVYLNALRRQQRPIYGKGLVDLLTLDTARRPFKQRPKVPQKIMSWFEEDSFLLHNAIPTLQQRAGSMETTIAKFACVTPAVVTGDMHKFLLGERGIEAFEEADLRLSAPVKYAPYMPKEPPLDPWHEARMRTTIQFPDKRLLQYDCGKLQVLDKLLRKLQAGNHRALIFTQMTKVLDILEQFLNIHGHKYLRLDGSTKVEQRQILTDRFNHDPRILVFILSSRSGGLGINLTGADTVIFYDQDWNPAMDKQCQDRCHRIGQTRDVHIYRLVSEHTIEANILRKASQKQMLDDVVIQEGEFTTDYFNKLSVRDVIDSTGEISANENDVVANAAMDRILGGVENSNPRVVGRVLEQAEDTEDVAAARLAEKEIQQDDADFLEQQPTPGDGSGASSVRQGTPRDGETIDLLGGGKTGPSGLGLFAESAADVDAVAEVAEVEYNAFGIQMHTIDDYMLQSMAVALEGTPLELPRDKKRSRKKGKDTRKR